MNTDTSFNLLTSLTVLLSSIGAINWGLIAALNLNAVEFLFGGYPLIVKIVYGLVGISGIFSLFSLYKVSCSGKSKEA
jgi:uncharacterized membrane protein YuzA (DUF378 family)